MRTCRTRKYCCRIESKKEKGDSCSPIYTVGSEGLFRAVPKPDQNGATGLAATARCVAGGTAQRRSKKGSYQMDWGLAMTSDPSLAFL